MWKAWLAPVPDVHTLASLGRPSYLSLFPPFRVLLAQGGGVGGNGGSSPATGLRAFSPLVGPPTLVLAAFGSSGDPDPFPNCDQGYTLARQPWRLVGHQFTEGGAARLAFNLAMLVRQTQQAWVHMGCPHEKARGNLGARTMLLRGYDVSSSQ